MLHMGPMNPYAAYLGTRDPLDVLSTSAARLRALAHAMGAARCEESPAPGNWSVREIACHLADTEIVFAFRLRQALAEDHHVIQPFDQERWAASYGAYSLEPALDLYSAVRAWNVTLIRALEGEAFERRLTHPERGEMSFQTLVETMAGHDLNHLAQIETIAARQGMAAF